MEANQAQFHHIQKSIILNLASKSPLRFSDLQPPRIPNNVFSYHLKKLVDGGYIESSPKGYLATRKALKLVVFDIKKQRQQTTPSTITTILVKNINGEILLINRDNKPFQGWYSLPSGLIHTGETLLQAAKRELFEKTTIMATDESLRPAGVIDFRYVHDETGDIFVHAIAFVYEYIYRGDVTELSDKQTKYGQLSWSTLGRKYILPEVLAVADMSKRGDYTARSIEFVEPTNIPVFASPANNY